MKKLLSFFMVFRGTSRSFFLFGMMMLSNLLTAGLPDPADRALVLPADVVISATPVTDGSGIVLGAVIPLKRAGRLFVMEGTINGETGNFILDTGASRLVLNSTYFRNSVIMDEEEGGGVTGSTGAVGRMTVRKLIVSDMLFSGIAADVTSLGHLENRRGIKILGLFGMNMLQSMEIVIDLSKNELQLYKVDRNGNRPSMTTPPEKYDFTQELKIFKNVLFVKAQVDGKELDFCLDTGAESNLLHSLCPQTVMDKVTITRRTSLRGSGQKQGEILMGTLNDLRFGGRQFGPIETAVCSLTEMSEKYGCHLDGMLGYDFFIRGRIVINTVRKEMGVSLNKEGQP